MDDRPKAAKEADLVDAVAMLEKSFKLLDEAMHTGQPEETEPGREVQITRNRFESSRNRIIEVSVRVEQIARELLSI